jgi:hypothetical protein
MMMREVEEGSIAVPEPLTPAMMIVAPGLAISTGSAIGGTETAVTSTTTLAPSPPVSSRTQSTVSSWSATVVASATNSLPQEHQCRIPDHPRSDGDVKNLA